MIVAYLGNYRRPWSTETHIAASLEAEGHTVIRVQEDGRADPWPEALVAARRAHMFMWTRTWGAHPASASAALAEMRAEGIPTVSFHLDRYIGLDREAQIRDGDPFWATEWVFTADGGNQAAFAAYGVNHHWLPPAVHDAECVQGRPDRRRFPHEVVFVGSHPYPHAEWRPYRDEVIRRCEQHYGHRFTVWPKNNTPIRGKDLASLYASAKVVVGDSCLSGGATHYWSDRIPETLGRGGALVHPDVEGLADWYTHGVDLLTYPQGEFDRLIEYVDLLLADGDVRTRMAANGQAKVAGRDTYRHRMVSVLGTVFADQAPRDVPVPDRQHRARHRGNPRPRMFTVRDGHPTDSQVVDEVWRDDQYGITRAAVAGKVVVDVGANIGAFTVLAAELGAAQVHAYEPEPSNHRLLLANTLNLPAVVPFDAALGDRDGFINLAPGPGGTHGGGSHVTDGDGTRVRMFDVADAFDMLGPIGLLKLDCEGGEYAIVARLADTGLLARVESIVGEWHGPVMPHLADRWPDNDAFLASWGYWVGYLADYGHLELHGHPRAGGVFKWRRF